MAERTKELQHKLETMYTYQQVERDHHKRTKTTLYDQIKHLNEELIVKKKLWSRARQAARNAMQQQEKERVAMKQLKHMQDELKSLQYLQNTRVQSKTEERQTVAKIVALERQCRPYNITTSTTDVASLRMRTRETQTDMDTIKQKIREHYKTIQDEQERHKRKEFSMSNRIRDLKNKQQRARHEQFSTKKTT